MRLVDILEGFANYEEFGTYLLPIKKVSGRLYATADHRGDSSRRTIQMLILLKEQINFAQAFLDDTFERDRAFNAAVLLLDLKEEIDDTID